MTTSLSTTPIKFQNSLINLWGIRSSSLFRWARLNELDYCAWTTSTNAIYEKGRDGEVLVLYFYPSSPNNPPPPPLAYPIPLPLFSWSVRREYMFVEALTLSHNKSIKILLNNQRLHSPWFFHICIRFDLKNPSGGVGIPLLLEICFAAY